MSHLPKHLAEATRLWAQVAQIGMESQMVIGMRMAGMMGILPQRRDEPTRMVTEKLDAAQESGRAMVTALTRGASPEKVISAGLKPYAKRTSANAKRLTHQTTRR